MTRYGDPLAQPGKGKSRQFGAVAMQVCRRQWLEMRQSDRQGLALKASVCPRSMDWFTTSSLGTISHGKVVCALEK